MTNEELKRELLEMLNNVYFWDTCPQEYKDRIDAINESLTKPVVVDEEPKLNVLCSSCSKEYDLYPYMQKTNEGMNINFMSCPHCKERNHHWLCFVSKESDK